MEIVERGGRFRFQDESSASGAVVTAPGTTNVGGRRVESAVARFRGESGLQDRLGEQERGTYVVIVRRYGERRSPVFWVKKDIF